MKYKPLIVTSYWREMGIPMPEMEYAFHPTRKFRWDFCWPDHRLALECEGGVWSGGRHGRGSGIKKDMEKQTEAAMLGWRILRFVPDDLCVLETTEKIKAALAWRMP